VTKSPRFLLRCAPLVATAALALSACGGSSAVTSSSDVFTVNGRGYSKTTFNAITQSLIDAKQFTAVNGKIKTADAAVVIKTLVRYEAFVDFIAKKGVKTTEADRQKVLKDANADQTFTSSPKVLQDLLVDLNVASLTLQSMQKASEADIKKLYEASPASSGALCMSHILVKTEKEAEAVLADLDKGVSFAEEAKKKSTEPGADKSGGSLGSGDSKCAALSELQTSFDKDFMAGAVNAKMGVPTGPVKSQFGYHIILNHKYDDVKESLISTVNSNAGSNLLAGYMTTAKISVNSAYGVWNSAIAAIN
jgi:PPIC-type PPIASE domain